MCLFFAPPPPKSRGRSKGKKSSGRHRSPATRRVERPQQYAYEAPPVASLPPYVQHASGDPYAAENYQAYAHEAAWPSNNGSYNNLDWQSAVLPALESSVQRIVDDSVSRHIQEHKLDYEALRTDLESQRRRLDSEEERRQLEERQQREQAVLQRARHEGVEEGRQAAARDRERKEREEQRIRDIVDQDRRDKQRVQEAVERARKEEREKLRAEHSGRSESRRGRSRSRSRRYSSISQPPVVQYGGGYHQPVTGGSGSNGSGWVPGAASEPGPMPGYAPVPGSGSGFQANMPQADRGKAPRYPTGGPFESGPEAYGHFQHQSYPPRFYFQGNTQGGVHCYT